MHFLNVIVKYEQFVSTPFLPKAPISKPFQSIL